MTPTQPNSDQEPDFNERAKQVCNWVPDIFWPYQKMLAIEFERFYRLGQCHAASQPTAKFDRKAYQRELMRKRHAEGKA